jgi:hypothetical protein
MLDYLKPEALLTVRKMPQHSSQHPQFCIVPSALPHGTLISFQHLQD